MTTGRRVFVSTQQILDEWQMLPAVDIDYVTFSGTGEPMLAANLGECASALSSLTTTPLAVLTNSSLMWQPQLRQELSHFDVVVAKLDADNQTLFELINRPAPGITFARILEGICAFAEEYPSKLSLQMMFVEANAHHVEQMASLATIIGPHEVQVNTPLRPSPTPPLSKERMDTIKSVFQSQHLCVVSVYDKPQYDIMPIDARETARRRPRRDTAEDVISSRKKGGD